ncbi:MAG: RNA polymerase sigma factor SigF [Armatimonadota bacterium]
MRISDSSREPGSCNTLDWSEQQAEELFREYKHTRDPELRERLIVLHQNLVRYLAGKFANRGEPLEDLIQVGTIGLINAIDRFDPDRGTKFSTYATPTIVGEIRRYFRDKAWSLKVPRRLQELNQAATKVAEELSQKLGNAPTIQEIAKKLGTSEEETLEAMELGSAYEAVSLDSSLEQEDDLSSVSLGELVGGTDISIENIETYDDVKRAIERLDPREKAIIYYRFFRNMSQTEVAKRLNISQMHVSRLQQRALKKLREMLTE